MDVEIDGRCDGNETNVKQPLAKLRINVSFILIRVSEGYQSSTPPARSGSTHTIQKQHRHFMQSHLTLLWKVLPTEGCILRSDTRRKYSIIFQLSPGRRAGGGLFQLRSWPS